MNTKNSAVTFFWDVACVPEGEVSPPAISRSRARGRPARLPFPPPGWNACFVRVIRSGRCRKGRRRTVAKCDHTSGGGVGLSGRRRGRPPTTTTTTTDPSNSSPAPEVPSFDPLPPEKPRKARKSEQFFLLLSNISMVSSRVNL